MVQETYNLWTTLKCNINEEKVSIEIAPEFGVFAPYAMAVVSFGFHKIGKVLHQLINYQMAEPHIVQVDNVGGRECTKCQGR
jgi:hypothetical protein